MSKLDVDPLTGEETEKIVGLIVGTPLPIIQKVQAATAVKDVGKSPDGGAGRHRQ